MAESQDLPRFFRGEPDPDLTQMVVYLAGIPVELAHIDPDSEEEYERAMGEVLGFLLRTDPKEWLQVTELEEY